MSSSSSTATDELLQRISDQLGEVIKRLPEPPAEPPAEPKPAPSTVLVTGEAEQGR